MKPQVVPVKPQVGAAGAIRGTGEARTVPAGPQALPTAPYGPGGAAGRGGQPRAAGLSTSSHHRRKDVGAVSGVVGAALP